MSFYSGTGKRLDTGKGNGRPASGKRLKKGGPSGKRALGRALSLCLLAVGLALCVCLRPQSGEGKAKAPAPPWEEEVPRTTPSPIVPDPDPEREQDPEQETGPKREDGQYVLSFAGDCVLGTEHDRWGVSGTFPAVVGEDYDYPLAGVKSLFAGDDFTFVNLESALTDHTIPAEKTFRFRGPPAYGQILVAGSVEGVSLANNHTQDYGQTGLADTRRVLAELGVAAGGDCETFVYTTERGLKVGVYTAYHISKWGIEKGIRALKEQGAEVIVTAFHSGTEGDYAPSDSQRTLFRYAADCGADIVYNSHPHVLQPMERYGESVIFYSLGNFCFGGNRNPADKDTAVLQVTVERQADGALKLSQVTAHPCSVSSRSDRNDFQPTLYEPDSPGALRVASKLAGTYRPPVVPSQTPAPAESPEESQIVEELPEDPAEEPAEETLTEFPTQRPTQPAE